MTDFLCPKCGPICEDDGLLFGPDDSDVPACCAFCGCSEEEMTPLTDAYGALEARCGRIKAELQQSQQAQGEPIGYLDSEALSELRRGHPAKIYAPGNMPWGKQRFVYLEPAPEAVPGGADHPDNQAVDRFARAMKSKLAHARSKGRSGWDNPDQCSEEGLATMLLEHIGKENPGTFEDIANFCMMLHQRGAEPSVLQQVAPPAPAAVPEGWSISHMEPLVAKRILLQDPEGHAGVIDTVNNYLVYRFLRSMLAAAPAPAEPNSGEQ